MGLCKLVHLQELIDCTCQRHFIIFSFRSLPSFTYHDNHAIRPRCCQGRYSLQLYGRGLSRCRGGPFFPFSFFSLFCGWTFWLIRCLGYCESCGPEKTCVCVIMKEDFSLDLRPEVGLLGHKVLGGCLGGSDGKESTWSVGDAGLIPGWGRSPGGGHGSPLQYSCLENPMDGEARLQSMGWQRFRQN